MYFGAGAYSGLSERFRSVSLAASSVAPSGSRVSRSTSVSSITNASSVPVSVRASFAVASPGPVGPEPDPSASGSGTPKRRKQSGELQAPLFRGTSLPATSNEGEGEPGAEGDPGTLSVLSWKRLVVDGAHPCSRSAAGGKGMFGLRASETSADRAGAVVYSAPQLLPIMGPVLVARHAIVYGDGSLSVTSESAISGAVSGAEFGGACVVATVASASSTLAAHDIRRVVAGGARVGGDGAAAVVGDATDSAPPAHRSCGGFCVASPGAAASAASRRSYADALRSLAAARLQCLERRLSERKVRGASRPTGSDTDPATPGSFSPRRHALSFAVSAAVPAPLLMSIDESYIGGTSTQRTFAMVEDESPASHQASPSSNQGAFAPAALGAAGIAPAHSPTSPAPASLSASLPVPAVASSFLSPFFSLFAQSKKPDAVASAPPAPPQSTAQQGPASPSLTPKSAPAAALAPAPMPALAAAAATAAPARFSAAMAAASLARALEDAPRAIAPGFAPAPPPLQPRKRSIADVSSPRVSFSLASSGADPERRRHTAGESFSGGSFSGGGSFSDATRPAQSPGGVAGKRPTLRAHQRQMSTSDLQRYRGSGGSTSAGAGAGANRGSVSSAAGDDGDRTRSLSNVALIAAAALEGLLSSSSDGGSVGGLSGARGGAGVSFSGHDSVSGSGGRRYGRLRHSLSGTQLNQQPQSLQQQHPPQLQQQQQQQQQQKSDLRIKQLSTALKSLQLERSRKSVSSADPRFLHDDDTVDTSSIADDGNPEDDATSVVALTPRPAGREEPLSHRREFAQASALGFLHLSLWQRLRSRALAAARRADDASPDDTAAALAALAALRFDEVHCTPAPSYTGIACDDPDLELGEPAMPGTPASSAHSPRNPLAGGPGSEACIVVRSLALPLLHPASPLTQSSLYTSPSTYLSSSHLTTQHSTSRPWAAPRACSVADESRLAPLPTHFGRPVCAWRLGGVPAARVTSVQIAPLGPLALVALEGVEASGPSAAPMLLLRAVQLRSGAVAFEARASNVLLDAAATGASASAVAFASRQFRINAARWAPLPSGRRPSVTSVADCAAGSGELGRIALGSQSGLIIRI